MPKVTAPLQPRPPPAPPSRIILKLVVEEARELKAADMNGKSDPYCVVKLIGKDGETIDIEEKRTDVISATLEPVWNAPFEIGRVVDLNSVKAVRFDLKDHDTFQRHDSLGSVEVPFSRFRMSPASTAQSEPIDEWFRVELPKKTGFLSSPRHKDSIKDKEHVVKDWGELHVRMSISGPNLVDFFHNSELDFVSTSPVATRDLNDSSDPYCELTLLDDHGRPIPGEFATTATMHRTRNPAWTNEHHVFGLICHIETAASLKVRIVDYDKTNRKDPLGFVLINLDQLSAHKWTEWHALQPEESMSTRENLGEIQLKIWLIGERRGEHARRLKIDKELHLKAHSQSIEQLEYENAQFEMHDAASRTGLEGQALLEVTVVQASELKQNQKQAGGTGSTATPYAVIELDPSVCVEECKRTSAPLSPQKSKRIAAILKVEIRTGHGLSPADMNGYSDPYCTLSITDRTTGKAIEAEKKRTAVVSKTLNPVWANENFMFGSNVSLSEAKSLLIHVKDHNNIGRSTPLGRVEIPLSGEEIRAEARTLDEKAWQRTGRAVYQTEVVGNATVLAELLQRMSNVPMEKLLSFSDIQSEASIEMSMSTQAFDGTELEGEKTEILQLEAPIRTSSSKVLGSSNTATWREETFSLSLSYPGIFSDAKYPSIDTQLLQLRVHEAQNLLISGAAGDRTNIGSTPAEVDAVEGSTKSRAQDSNQWQRNAANVYFTVVPVRRDGTLEDAERIQSLTVYNARDPSWPVQDFVFGKIKDISNVSYLSLHLYERDVESNQETVLSNLLTDKEKKLDVCLKRFQLHKLSPSGEVEDDDFELLQFGQQVLAFRGGEDGGRFYPARIQRYIPFPSDEYEVRFDDEINTIDELRNLISLDVKGVVQAERSNGRLDVAVDIEVSASANSVKRSSRYVVKPTQLVPVNSLTGNVEQLMARRLDMMKEGDERWAKMQHMISGIVIDVLSASDLVVPVIKDGKVQKMKHLDKNDNLTCRVTLLGKPMQKGPNLCYFNDRGELFTRETMSKSTWEWKTDKQLEATIGVQNEAEDNETVASEGEKENGIVLFQNHSLVIGRVEKISHRDTNDKSTDAKEAKVEYRYQPVDPSEAKVGHQILEQTSSILIQVNAKVKVEKHAEMGSKKKSEAKDAELVDVTLGFAKIDLAMLRNKQQTLRLQIVPPKSANVPYYKAVGSLFVRITTSSDDYKMKQIRSTARAEDPEQPRSEFVGRTMDKLSHEVRKEIVVGLENELLELAGAPGPRVCPASDISREEWVRLRTERQKLLQENGTFFMREQTSASVVSVPRSFTGDGIIAWFRRQPSVLWDDKWEVYCNDAGVVSSCKLGWRNQSLEYDPDALQAPTDDVHALQWMSALCAAGFVENITPGIGFSKQHVLLECRDDRFYRLREVDMWMENLSRENSLFPLDLVREIDCYRDPVLPGSKSSQENEQTQQITTKEARSYAKKLTEYCDGFLGMHTMLSSVLLAVKDWKNSLMPPVAENPSDLTAGKTEKDSVESPEEQGSSQVVENILWDWKYCLFVPSRKHLYIYEKETSTAPMAFIDVASAACKVAYNFSNDVKGGWMDIVNPTVCVRKPNSKDFVAVTPEILNKMTKTRTNGDKAIEVKTSSTQKWIQALARSGVCVDMRPGQEVLMKRLNPIILQQKCNKHATEFDPNDLEGSFQRLLNRLFGHDKGLSRQDHEKEIRELRAQVRSELKKAGSEGDTVMAYYGKGKNRRSRPVNSGNFKNDSLYSGRILRIRTPFTDEKYQFKTTYDMTDTNEVPTELSKLLAKYKVTDKASWLSLPKSQRDMFLLYDVEYSHANERITEEGLMRGHIRTNEGDLDPQKVSEKCADLNILFKATDLENCVSRMVKHRYRYKPLGVLKIHTKMISPHRTLDAWYPLAPASDMLQRTNLGQIRVEMKLVQKREVTRSAKLPSIPEDVKIEEITPQLQDKNTLLPQGKDVKGKLPFAVGKEPSFVKVSILEGRSLPVADMFTSDPFVEIVLVGEDSKERDTSLKTDIKMKTLNPKWENQEFLLGKTEKTKLSDKKAVLLRVMDYDAASANDPLGCVTIEFQRSETGYIRGLILKQADAYGNATTQELKLNDQSRVEVDAMLLPVSGKAKIKKRPVADGVLGKLHFVLEIIRNDNSVSPNEKRLKTTTIYSAEIAIKKAIKNAGPQEDWSKYSCYFQPHGDGRLRVKYDPASEDLGSGNSFKLSDLLSSTASLASSGKASQATSSFYTGAFKVLGRTYDLSKVDYFDVRLVSESTGRIFEGQLGKSELKSNRKFSLKNPNLCSSFRDETVVLTDRDSKETVTLTFDLNLVGILRADRVRRLLADTFRLVGLAFDSRTFNHNGGRFNLEQLNKDVETFLWENCQANLIPGRNVAEELLAQIRIMSQASKLHWKVTPQLLGYVFELVLLSGDNDRLSYANTVALDAVLNRWSRVLAQVTEAKDYLTGNFHGKKTPRVLKPFSRSRFSPFCIDDRVTVKLPFFKHAGVVADTQLRGGEFVAARIVKECGAGLFNVKICAESQEILQERLGKLKDGLEPREEWRTHRSMSSIVLQVDGELLKCQLQNEDFVQISEEHIVTTEPNSTTSVSRMDDTKTDSSSTIITGKTRPGKITHSYGGARYDVVFTDGQVPVDAKVVNRSRLIPVCNETMYDGRITSIYAPAPVSDGVPQAIKYTVSLENGEWSTTYHTLENRWWGSDKIVKVYAMLPAAVKSIQVRNATTNKLVETVLMELNKDQPRFVGQYHGFVKGETFDKKEAEQLELVYSAVCKRRMHNGSLKVAPQFSKKNCFYLIVAPPPLVQIRGQVRPSPKKVAIDGDLADVSWLDASIEIKFQLSVPYNDQDSVDMDKLSWILTTSDNTIKSSMELPIDFTSQTGRSDVKPEVSLEPLDDIRVSVRDLDDNIHELHFRIDDILAETAVRRKLAPFHKAIVVSPPSENSSMRCRVRFLPTSTNKSNAGKSVNEATGTDTRFNTKSKGGEAEVDVPSGSIQFDKLHVKVFEASNMKFKEKMGGEGLQVEVVVVSSDFNKHMTVNSGKKITTPFGLEISSTGEILPDIYPKNSTFTLMYDSTQVAKRTSDASVSWKVKNGSPHVEFKYPVIDMDRVSEVRLVVRDKKSQTQVGIVTIPMGSINISRSVNVVGTLSLSVERIQKYSVNDEVYAKQLETSMDFWTICPKELLKMTLEQHESKLSRSFLAAGPLVSGEGKVLLSTPIDMELQLQKIAKVQMFDAMTMLQSSLSSRSVTLLPSSSEFQSLGNLKSRAMDTLQLTLQQTKAFMKDTAHELGLGHYVTERRLPWSSDTHVDENESQVLDNLDELYTLNADEDRVDVTKGENLLSFFDTEVEELEPEDQKIRLKLYQRLRLSKLIQVLDMIMKASVRVKVMDEDRNNVDGYLGTACIPLMDLLDQQPHDDVYELLYLPTTNLRGNRKTVQSRGVNDRGKIRLRLHLKVSESSYFEQAIEVYKVWKAKYIAQHEAARRRIHDTVVPAQRRRWTTMKSYLDELTMQANGKLHWERTPVLLSLVWDIFALQESSPTQSKKKSDADEAEYSQSIATMADKYRGAVMKVHKRWVNLQPKLDELLTIQAATQIHAKRTPEVLDDIEKEIEGLDVGLSTAWKQVKQKWQTLLDVLEELVRMNDGKLNLARAPQLLNTVEQRCSKGLDTRHSDAVSQIQSRWMAITQPNGPLSELQLMEKKGLHWRRTHELLLLLDEQCEGFADIDARALDTVQNRWEQVQEWLHEVVQMQLQHSIDSEHTPFILEKMQLWKPTRGKRQEEQNKLERSRSGGVAPSSQSADVTAVGRQRGLSRQSSVSRVSSDMSFQSAESTTEDNGQLEGMAEWYAIEETKYELERIPYHRITVDADKKNWLPFSRDGKDTRLLITQEEMIFTPANVRLALEDRGVIPKTSTFDPTIDASAKDDAWVKPSLLDSKSGSQTCVLPKHVDEEIKRLEKVLESQRDNNQPFTLPNPERVAELYEAMESLGKTNLLWNVSHAVSRNRELVVPENYQILLREMTIRQIPTTEVENLVKSLAFSLQKETLMAKGITVPTTANPTTLLQLMDEHQIKEVALPQGISSIQTLLEERGMDRKGEPVMLRGIRIGTQCTQTSTPKAINTGLGIIDTQIEALRRTLLFEALRKRNSLVRTFAGESHVLDDETERTEADMFAAAVANAEVDVSGDYLTLVERFQRLLVHESYTKRLAEYAALDRCMRALLGKSRDEAVTKEEIAVELHNVNKRVIGANYRLPPEAFTREELLQAVATGRIRTPSDEMLSHCPEGENASAMAHYAAISYAANVFQEVTSFRSRVDLAKNRLQDTFPYDECSSLDGVLIPKQRTRRTFGQSIADWLLGFDASALSIKRKLSAAHRQRLEWASAAFTLRNRWLQHGLGWCDHEFGEGVGVKVLLDRLLIFEAANKMDMVKTEKLLREVRDKCSRLRDREQEAQAKLEERYQANLALLEKLVTHAERCMNNRKLHSEETPVLLHKLEQYHTEGKAGSEELSEDKVAASAQRVAPELQATFVDRKLNEVRLGQRKEPSSLHLNLSTEDDVAGQSADDTEWKELSPSKRVVQPLSPHEKQTSWKVVKNAVAVNAAFSATSPRKPSQKKLR
ncbi:C2 domain [Phytophthora cactorum]|nr:C2 domain [Phytophthora cactorum]